MLKVDELFPENYYYGKDGGELDDHFKHIHKWGGCDADEGVGELHVGGAGNGEELCDAFYDGEDDGLDESHAGFGFWCKETKKRRLSIALV